MRPIRRRYSAAMTLSVALSLGLLMSGCGGDSSAATDTDTEVFLTPVAAPGPDPFTTSTARSLSAPEPPAPSGSATSPPSRGQTLRTVSGATPGLYGGTQSIGSCDVEQQITLLNADEAKAEAFAKGAGISEGSIPAFLRGLTSVVLRADTRVTNHGYQGGSAESYQAVLQAGTSVLVDEHGAPRVRCACGNPLKPPVAVEGAVVQKGTVWTGYRPDQVVVVKPAAQELDSLVIVNIVNNTWIERKAGSDGEQDKRPEVLPPVAPDDIFTYPPVQPDQPDDPATPSTPSEPVVPGDPSDGTSPVDPPVPNDPNVAPPVDPPSEELPPVDPGVPTDGGFPPDPDLLLPSELPAEPVRFEG